MTPKEKAAELVEKFESQTDSSYNSTARDKAKQCALIAVDEVLNALPIIPYGIEYLQNRDYYEEVKQEIENL